MLLSNSLFEGFGHCAFYIDFSRYFRKRRKERFSNFRRRFLKNGIFFVRVKIKVFWTIGRLVNPDGIHTGHSWMSCRQLGIHFLVSSVVRFRWRTRNRTHPAQDDFVQNDPDIKQSSFFELVLDSNYIFEAKHGHKKTLIRIAVEKRNQMPFRAPHRAKLHTFSQAR